MSAEQAVRELVDTIHSAGESEEIERGSETLHAFIVPVNTRLDVVDPQDPKFTGRPRAAAGSATVWDAASFNAQWSKYALADSEVYADVEAFTVVGIYDAHQRVQGLDEPGLPNLGQHRTTLQVRKTPQWKAWEALDGRLIDQQQFAEHVEDRLPDFREPSGATMLELAQSFQATTNVEFKSAQVLSSSARNLVYAETVQAKAGQTGNIEIPATFTLGLKPFEGSPAYEVTARLRYRIRDGHLLIGYKIERPEDVLQAAFGDVVAEVESHVDPTPVLRGRP